jgi:hypothetical protein
MASTQDITIALTYEQPTVQSTLEKRRDDFEKTWDVVHKQLLLRHFALQDENEGLRARVAALEALLRVQEAKEVSGVIAVSEVA